MRGKLTSWCVCMIAIFLVSTTAYGEIYTWGDWDGNDDGATGTIAGSWDHSGTYAFADGDNTQSWAWGEGCYHVVTTEAAYLNWSYDGYVWVNGSANIGGGTYAGAIAVGTARIHRPWDGYYIVNFDFTANTAEANPDADGDAGSETSSTTRFIAAGKSIQCSHSAASYAYVDAGTAFSHACVHAFGDLWE